jgi:DNA gyrase/topoisomerase IV subunit A
MKVTPKTGPVIGAAMVRPEDGLLLLTSANKIIRLSVAEISTVGRATQGVMLVRMERTTRSSASTWWKARTMAKRMDEPCAAFSRRFFSRRHV